MTEPGARPSGGPPKPNVDEVIHDARELSGVLRDESEEGAEPTAAATADLAPATPDPAVPAIGGRTPVTVDPPGHGAGPGHDAGATAGMSGRSDPAAAAPPGHSAEIHAPAASLAPVHPGAAGAAAHGGGHSPAGHGGGHGAAPEEDDLGPVDTAAWGAGLLGAAVGLFVAFCFVLATSGANPF